MILLKSVNFMELQGICGESQGNPKEFIQRCECNTLESNRVEPN